MLLRKAVLPSVHLRGAKQAPDLLPNETKNEVFRDLSVHHLHQQKRKSDATLAERPAENTTNSNLRFPNLNHRDPVAEIEQSRQDTLLYRPAHIPQSGT